MLLGKQVYTFEPFIRKEARKVIGEKKQDNFERCNLIIAQKTIALRIHSETIFNSLFIFP